MFELLVKTFVLMLPWVVIAAAAMFAWQKKKAAPGPALLQAGAALFMFLAALGWIILLAILLHMDWYNLHHYAAIAGTFLQYLLLIAFAAGYCWERFAKKP